MKRNTGCGCGSSKNMPAKSHDKCPEPQACDMATTRANNCFVVDTMAGGTEETVVLTDAVLQVLVEADIDLPTPAREIKQIRKNVSLNQCKVLPSTLDPNIVKVFITGVVHKNIQFVDSCSGVVRDFSVDVPFSCLQQLTVTTAPTDDFSVKNSVNERRIMAADGHGADRCTFGSISFEIFNEPIRCKLLAAIVNELDILKHFDSYGRFSRITEKMEVILVVKLSQLQQTGAGIQEALREKFKNFQG